MNKTPIDLVQEYLFNTFDIYKDPEWIKQTMLFLKDLKTKEKEFAEDFFEAGSLRGMDVWASIEEGSEPTEPEFNQVYKQYES